VLDQYALCAGVDDVLAEVDIDRICSIPLVVTWIDIYPRTRTVDRIIYRRDRKRRVPFRAADENSVPVRPGCGDVEVVVLDGDIQGLVIATRE